MSKKQENVLFLGFAASLIASMGSLYFSEIKGYEPCTLCWYQRILMYPMTILYAVAIAKKDGNIWMYTRILSSLGMFVSAYHYSLQKLTFLTEAAPSCGRVPCTGEYINFLGFITIPFLALTAFVIIFISTFLLQRSLKEEKQ
ncbi:disulfide bond formation protein DsbB [Bacillus coahuilensis p1.1.43]|uniref:Probable disulfide formation protein n=1 Tax=Bacillus coahuilensis p1.1.43 TaxID=1150625 RepID=A0A147KB33_9BACI|nr:disulfide oxidoreductase [Bacillus coahuilensis]KUP08071.1 disulfide bond formation protein DsbB [Bacillus coahuilensis p1.1.43]